MDAIDQLATAAFLATADAFLGSRSRASRSRALNGLGQAFDPVESMMKIHMPGGQQPAKRAPGDFKTFAPIPGDPYKPGLSAGLIKDDGDTVYVRSKKGASAVPRVGDYRAFRLSGPERLKLRDLEIAWGRMRGDFGGVKQTKAFWEYVYHHAPALANKLVARRDAAERRREKGEVASFHFNMRSGVDWEGIAKLAAVGAAAYFIPLAFGAGGGSAGAGATSAGATSSASASTLAPVTLPASAVPISTTGAGATAAALSPVTLPASAVPISTASAGATAGAGATAAKVAAAPLLKLDPAGAADIVKESTALKDRIIDGVNKARTIKAIANGEVPPPPIGLEGDSFRSWATSLAESALEEKLQRRASDVERARLDRQIRDLQREAVDVERRATETREPASPATYSGAFASSEGWRKGILWAAAAAAVFVLATAASNSQSVTAR